MGEILLNRAFRRIFPDRKIIISSTDGHETFWEAGDLFTSHRDPNLLNWDLNISASETEDEEVMIIEPVLDGSFCDLFGDLDHNQLNRHCLEQSQAISFCRTEGENFCATSVNVKLAFLVTRFNEKVKVDRSNLFIVLVQAVNNHHFQSKVHRFESDLLVRPQTGYYFVLSRR